MDKFSYVCIYVIAVASGNYNFIHTTSMQPYHQPFTRFVGSEQPVIQRQHSIDAHVRVKRYFYCYCLINLRTYCCCCCFNWRATFERFSETVRLLGLIEVSTALWYWLLPLFERMHFFAASSSSHIHTRIYTHPCLYIRLHLITRPLLLLFVTSFKHIFYTFQFKALSLLPLAYNFILSYKFVCIYVCVLCNATCVLEDPVSMSRHLVVTTTPQHSINCGSHASVASSDHWVLTAVMPPDG